ncbi:MAG TPA: 4-(cytidine 5'-diphospho)-2-C-methyl-D-erythritol kinase [Gemmatimonadaceae bacterium]|nr:4-(cytidine 5'-diphospho)-2-C-methyl-D-erythritol kinase [Gemmatimonadaceae bacterium]
MSHAHVVAQAKLNLGLHVLAREASGFHSIETLFVRLALGDQVRVRTAANGRSIDCRGADAGPPEANLAFRAALAYQEAAGWPRGFAIEIEKAIPVGGGLGGGSADAGAVLRALNALAPPRRELPDHQLLRLAGALGSDVPFLTTTTSRALGWGRGERLLALRPLPRRHVVLVVPDFRIATRDAYEWLSARGEIPRVPSLTTMAELASWETLAPLARNDFERVVAARHPEILTIISALRDAGATIAHLTGTGSVVYGVFAQPPQLGALARSVPGRVIATRTAARARPVEAGAQRASA